MKRKLTCVVMIICILFAVQPAVLLADESTENEIRCAQSEMCEAVTHLEDCPYYEIDKKDSVNECTQDNGCEADIHLEGCPYFEDNKEDSNNNCTEDNECEAEIHLESCPKYTTVNDDDLTGNFDNEQIIENKQVYNNSRLSKVSSNSSTIAVGTGEAYSNIAGLLKDNNLTGDIVIELTSDISDLGGISIPKRVTSLTIQSSEQGTKRKIILYDSEYVQSENSIFCNGADLSISSDIEFYTGNYRMANIFGGADSIDTDGNPVITFYGTNTGKNLNIYGGGYNGSLNGSTKVNIGGTVNSVYGGGYGYNATADVTQNTTINIMNDAVVTGIVIGGGCAEPDPGEADKGIVSKANVYGDVYVNAEENSSVYSVTGGGFANCFVYNPPANTVYAEANVKGDVKLNLKGTITATGTGAPITGGGHVYFGGEKINCIVEANVEGDCITNLSGTINTWVIGGGYVETSSGSPEKYSIEGKRAHAGVGSVELNINNLKHTYNLSSSVYGGGYASGNYADYSVDRDVNIVVDGYTVETASSKKVDFFGAGRISALTENIDKTNASTIGGNIGMSLKNIDAGSSNTVRISGGFYAFYAAKGTVEGNISTEADGLVISEVHGATFTDSGASATPKNIDIKIKGDVNTKLKNCTVKTALYGTGQTIADTAFLKVNGTARLILEDFEFAGKFYMSNPLTAGTDNCAMENAELILLGNTTIGYISNPKGSVSNKFDIKVGDGTNDTYAKVNYFLFDSGVGIGSISIYDKAVLEGLDSTGNQLIYAKSVDISQNGKLILAHDQGLTDLSGEGVIALPAGKNINVSGSFTGNISLETSSGTAQAGDVPAFTSPSSTGIFTYSGEGLILKKENSSDVWDRWVLNIPETFTVNAVVTGNGGEVKPESVEVEEGSDAVFEVTVYPGYKVASVTVNGQDKTENLIDNVFTLNNVESDCDVVFNFEAENIPETYTVNAVVTGNGGEVKPESVTVEEGSIAVFEVTRYPGYKVALVTVDGQDKTENLIDNVFTLGNVESDCDVIFNFEYMAAEDVNNGIDNLPDIADKPTEEDKKSILDIKLDYEALPDEGKGQISKEGVSELNKALLKLEEIELNVEVNTKNETAANIPDAHMMLQSMTYDEAEKLKSGDISKYVLKMRVDEAEELTKEQQEALNSVLDKRSKAGSQFDISIQKHVISKSGDKNIQTINELTKPVTLVFDVSDNQPEKGYKREWSAVNIHGAGESTSIKVLNDEDNDDSTVTVSSSLFSVYTLVYKDEMVDNGQNGSGEDSSQEDGFLIDAMAGAGGTISPKGKVFVSKNSSRTFIIEPYKGYEISDIIVNGKSLGILDSYTFKNIVVNGSIEAVFKKATEKPDKEEQKQNKQEEQKKTDTKDKLEWKGFIDISQTDWFCEGVKFVYENGLMFGTSEAYFSPYEDVSRAMIVTVLWRLEGKPEANEDNIFADITGDDYYYTAVLWANENGIAVGYENGVFMPNAAVTREQMAAILYRYAQYKGSPVSSINNLNGFSDKEQISDYAVNAVDWAVENGIMNGSGDGKIDPKGNATRAQVSVILKNMIK